MSIQKLDNNWTETSSRNLNYKDRLLVSVRRDLDHFNKANPGTGWTTQNMFQYKLESQVKDHLVFIHSELSPHYYSSARFKAAFFQREPEPITHGDVYFHGSGRYNLFNIIHPSPNLRLIVDFSRTSLGKGRSKLPSKAIVVGEKDYPLPFVGHGSARVVSPPLTPEYFEQNAYITLDFGEVPRPIEKDKTGLMRLWGVKFNLDDRRLVGFMRDASVITEEQYLALPRPTKINQFPEDLSRYPGLEYSGLFEDGWVAEDAFFKLGPSRAGQILTFKGVVPNTEKFRTKGVDVTVSINEKPTEIVNLKAGEFTLTRLIKEATQITSISLHFSDAQVYGTDDPRPVSASVSEISIGDLPDLTSFRKLTNQQGDKFDLTGVDEDGWIARQSKMNAPAFDTFKVLKIDLEMPGWAPVATNTLDVSVNGRPADRQAVARTSYTSLLLPLAAGQRTNVQLDAATVFPLPNEKRERAFLIKNISFENLSPTDLFARGWHRSGYLFSLDRADNDGWVDRHIAFSFPATKQFKTAIIEVVRFPAKADLPLTVGVNGADQPAVNLGLEKTERITVALAADRATAVTLDAPRNFALAAPDTRLRSFRIVNIDFQ
jgi:hypothetical protein